jgi:uncharacterized protein
MNKHTLILGASTNPERYSFKAAEMLTSHQHTIALVGNKAGEVCGETIHTEMVHFENIHTVTLYLNPTNQIPYYEYIFLLSPNRIIANPGTENHDLKQLCFKNNVQYEEACTLVLLSTGQY